MENLFKNGDKVFLELTYPGHDEKAMHIMQVLGYNSRNEVVCYWFDQNGVFHKEDFEESFLKKYEAPPEPPFVDTLFF